MKILPSALPEILIIEPSVFQDERGFFMETYQQRRYTEAGIESIFVQDNLSRSVRGTLRGLHYQVKHAQAKLIQVIEGTVFDVALDIRRGSPYFGQWTSVHLSDENKRQLFLPEGFAHGFSVLSETAGPNSDIFPGDAVNPFVAALEGPANAIHGIGARRTAKVHWTFDSGSPL